MWALLHLIHKMGPKHTVLLVVEIGIILCACEFSYNINPDEAANLGYVERHQIGAAHEIWCQNMELVARYDQITQKCTQMYTRPLKG